MPNLPELPAWLDNLLDQPFSRENSLEVDRWLAYLSTEWEVQS